jgi:hypothetical protein
MSIQLTIERQTQRFDPGIVGIGRASDNQFSLPDDGRLAPFHAVLKSIHNRWIVESRDGGPVRIGTGRPVQFAWLNSGDVIQLTNAGPELLFEVVTTTTVTPQRPAGPTSSAVPHDAGIRVSLPVEKEVWRVTNPAVIVAAIVPLGLLVTVWMLWPQTSRTESRVSDNSVSAVNPLINPPTAKDMSSVPSPLLVDPRERLILIGVGDLKHDRRPHVLGVGWLWNERTAVVPRLLGDFLESLIRELKTNGILRQGFVIQGVSLEIAQILSPVGCPEISILHLKNPAESPKQIREQWQRVTANDIERRRRKGKKFSRLSFRLLPRSPEMERAQRESSVDSKALGYVNSLSWMAYDPEITEFSECATEEARFVFERAGTFSMSQK